MMSIIMIGGVYCPLSSRDPKQRLYGLIEQVHSRLILVHYLTKTKFNDNIMLLFDIDSILIEKNIENDLDQLSRIFITPDNVAYIIFTSGSTGIPKAVCL